MSSLNAVLEQYEKSQAESQSFANQKPKISEEERLQRYFNPILPKGEKSGKMKIRILPSSDSSVSPFKEAYFHEIFLNGKWTKIYDPGKNDNERSPLNETEAALKLKGDAASKELAKTYRSKKFLVVKVIDRDHEEHGVKFWRIKSSWKGDGIFDKIAPLYMKRGDIADPKTGRDLELNLVETTSNGKTYYTAVSSIIDEEPTPLNKDKTIAAKWLADATEWKEVYSKKPLEYLEGVAAGFEPYWSKTAKKYVWGEDTAEATSSPATQTFTSPDLEGSILTGTDEDPSDDLPF